MASIELRISVPDQHHHTAVIDSLVADRVASRICGHDATLWGPDAGDEAQRRLDWTTLYESSVPLIDEVTALRDELRHRGLDHVVLCGMGGSSLAPEVICAAANVAITILDSSQPDQVRAALGDRLESSVVVVSSKSGSTVETDSMKRAYEAAFREAGRDPVDHLVIVTDPDSPLDKEARANRYRVFNADPDVGGRYSALTAFGLVPSGLAGASIADLLTEAKNASAALATDRTDNPGIQLGALIAESALAGADKLVIADSSADGLGNWIEQLIAESTGKQGKGILPVVVDSQASPNFHPNSTDSVLVAIAHSVEVEPDSGRKASVTAPLGAQFLMWEYATAIAGIVLGIDPFNQPDVERAKDAARDLLDGGSGHPEPDFMDGTIAIYGSAGLLTGATQSLQAAVESLLAVPDSQSYLAIHAYLNRAALTEFAAVRDAVAQRTGRPTTFGWGPRFLHSTGQYHKGGPPQGVFLQITCEPASDLQIDGRDFTFGEFCASQAVGDGQVLVDHDRPVLRLHAQNLADLDRVRQALT